jgi:hypothetical protein
MGTMLRFMGQALLHARFDVLGGFLRTGKVRAADARELAERQHLLEAASGRLARAAPGGRAALDAGRRAA